jgi:hypothetical protein
MMMSVGLEHDIQESKAGVIRTHRRPDDRQAYRFSKARRRRVWATAKDPALHHLPEMADECQKCRECLHRITFGITAVVR